MNKAYSTFLVKEMDESKRIIKGVASTVTPDRMHDIVEPKGAKFKLPLPLLSQHEHHLPIGHIEAAKVTDSDIQIEASIAKDTGLDYVDDAWKQIKAGLVRGLSIGFRALEYAFIEDSDGIHFKEWEWYELSAVTIPANAECNIISIKNFCNNPALRKIALESHGIRPEVARAIEVRRSLGLAV